MRRGSGVKEIVPAFMSTIEELLNFTLRHRLDALCFLGLALVALVRCRRLARERARERAEAERQLQLAKVAADEASRTKSDFLAVMSHEIRTPLNAVMGFANLLSETKLDEAQRGYVATITSEGARLSSLINDILDLTKLDEGKLALEHVPFSPVETIREVLRLMGARAAERKLDLRLEAQLAGPLLIAGDPLRFRQVVLNLVDNAIKFTPSGAITVFVNWAQSALDTSQGRLQVRVRDTGIGIAPEKTKDLFQMFVQADASTTRNYGGTGLGLAICQRIVGLMGGEIGVQSTPGQGSEFSFSLTAPRVLLPTEPLTSQAAPPSGPVSSPRILIVDDMETNRLLLHVFLKQGGFEPDLAINGEEAIRKAAESRYDAILMDLQMPGIDGYSAAQRIRASEPPGHRTPIIALTALVAKGTREKCFEAGMDEHMTKPLDLQRFRALLHQVTAEAAAPSSRSPFKEPAGVA